ncbi:MAG: mechanosensitive ion channel [Clostridiales bacterium]|nr:mechanosensitive ion channel [Clostridiales bacterium]
MSNYLNIWKGNINLDIISELIKGYFKDNQTILKYFSLIILSIIVVLVCLLAFHISKKLIKRILPRYINQSISKFSSILYEHGFQEKLAHVIPVIIIYLSQPLFNEYSDFIKKVADTYFVIVFVIIAIALLDSINELYKQFEISKTRPITPILQIVKVLLFIVAGIVFVGIIIRQNPLTLLGGIGALSAVFSLVFKDPILGFVAGVQLTSTDMLRVGDIITVPKYNAEGTVTDIGLTTISLQAFDKKTVTIPSYSLITDSFTNYRGMQDSGARRFRRIFYIDINSIKLCSKEDIEKFKKVEYLNEHINKRREKVISSLPDSNITEEDIIREMGLTNIEILRVCAQKYVEAHEEIRKDMTLVVRQLSPEDKGMPIEIYAFTDTTTWVLYERIQEEILDHVYYLASKLGLKLYQSPSSSDFMNLICYKE